MSLGASICGYTPLRQTLVQTGVSLIRRSLLFRRKKRLFNVVGNINSRKFEKRERNH